jgi:hypothetical protein
MIFAELLQRDALSVVAVDQGTFNPVRNRVELQVVYLG